MIRRNPGIANLQAGYLFPEIAKRKREFQAAHPEAKIISLGIGNTTEAIPPYTNSGLRAAVDALGDVKTYTGYGDEQGLTALREKIASLVYSGKFSADEVFISDGAKCDIGRLQLLFGQGISVVVQDPSYPVYVDGSVLVRAVEGLQIDSDAGTRYKGIVYLPCTPQNNFFPDLSLIPQGSLIYFCSPNNPTGAVADRNQLGLLTAAAREKNSLIIFDAAYSEYIRDPELPKSIFEIEGAASCAIEINSFSKSIGFTGVRLGWSVVPKELKYSTGESIHSDWNRICTTIFNGASNIAQAGGLAALDSQGLAEMRRLTDYYLSNSALIKNALNKHGIQNFGGENAPYIWAYFPGRDSWELFSEILEKCEILCTPGSGFGPAGQSFIRFSAFGRQPDIQEACRRLEKL